MAKWQADLILDEALLYIKDNVTQMSVCNAQPTTYAQAVTNYKLAIKSGLTGTDFTGPEDATPNGRKLTTNQQSNIAVDTGGDATHIALCSGANLLYVTTCSTLTLTLGSTVTIPAWSVRIADAT